jgi:quercetin dioxygenase-like cupin family protein
MRKSALEDVAPETPLLPGWNGVRTRSLVDERRTGAQRGVLAIFEIEPGGEIGLHRRAACEGATFVLRGGGSHLTPGRAHPQPQGTAAYVPRGAWHGFRSEVDSVTTLVAAFSGVTDLAHSGLEALDGTASPSPSPEVHLASLAATAADARLDEEAGFWGMGVHWLVGGEAGGAERLVLGASTFHPDGTHELHRHPHGEEFLLVVEGGGAHLFDGGEMRQDPGEASSIPAGEWHGFRTDDGVTTRAVFGYFGVASLDAAGYEVLTPSGAERLELH